MKMHKTNTLSDITNIMEKIGCYNKTFSENKLHENYLGGVDEDKYARSSNNNLGDQDNEFTKVTITPSYSILYNASRSGAIDSILKNGASHEFLRSSAGTAAWGEGIYTNFQLFQCWWRSTKNKKKYSNKEGGLYGDQIVKFKYNGNLKKECLIAVPNLQQKKLSTQIKSFPKLEELIKKHGFSLKQIDEECNGLFSSHAIASFRHIANRMGITMDKLLMGCGVSGVVFFGENDGPVAVIYDVDKLEVVDYINNKGNNDINSEVKWEGDKKIQKGNKEVNYANPFTNFFHERYVANERIARGHSGTLLVKDTKTNKYTYLDLDVARQMINQHNINGDPRLFGKYEFDWATNFSDESTPKAQVLIDKEDKNSLFYVDTDGNLYVNDTDKKPFTTIADYFKYYLNQNTKKKKTNSDNGKPFNYVKPKYDTYDDIDDEAFNLEESLSEDRTISNDGHVELDNFSLARNIMDFSKPGNAYFIKLAERHKDHPDRHYEHDACDYKSFFEVTSIEHLNAIENVIKKLCQNGEWRAMLYINPRSMVDTRSYANDVLAPRFKKYKSHLQGHEVEVAYGQSKSGVDRKGKDWDKERPLCFVDVDNDDPKIHKQVVDYIKKMGITPLDMYKTTNNGLHVILPDSSQAKKLDFSFLDNGKDMGKWATAGLELDKSITLYAYVNAKGYGVQKKMQQRILRK